MKKFKVPCTWMMGADIIVDAEDVDEACSKAEEAPLPDDAYYIDGSFDVYIDEIEEVDDAS